MGKEKEQSEFVSKLVCEIGASLIENDRLIKQNLILKDKLFEIHRTLRAYLEKQ